MRSYGCSRHAWIGILLIALSLGVFANQPVSACPFCQLGQMQTYSEMFEQSSIAVVAVWVSAQRPDETRTGKTKYRITQVLQDGTGKFKPGAELELERFRAGKPNDQFLILATRRETVEWGSPIEATPALIDYIVGVPRGKPGATRLSYFLKFLEHSETSISDDAYAEFANAPYKEIVPLANEFPRKKLREWVLSPSTSTNRLGLYGMMLGLCGHGEDAEVLQQKILEPVDKDTFRLGIDGVIGGYLLLTREQGLEKLEQVRLKDKNAPFSEVYAVIQALRFVWTYSPGTIAPQKLREAMRMILDRPELADMVITDLARWRDWDVQDRLVKMYSEKSSAPLSTRRAIIRYLLVCQKDMSPVTKEIPPHVKHAREGLEQIRKLDPRTVADVERFPPM